MEQSTLLVSKEEEAPPGSKKIGAKNISRVSVFHICTAPNQGGGGGEREKEFFSNPCMVYCDAVSFFSLQNQNLSLIFSPFSFSPTAYKSFCFTIAPSFSQIMEGEIIGGGNGGKPTLLLVFFPIAA